MSIAVMMVIYYLGGVQYFDDLSCYTKEITFARCILAS